MSAEEINKEFKKWNPMEHDYKDKKFNHYITGPGADLDAELQTGKQNSPSTSANANNKSKSKEKKQPVPTLVFKNIPKNMTINAIHNICSKHGRVKNARDSKKNAFFFVDLATVADMEAVLRALENNDYGFIVQVANRFKNNSDMDQNITHQNVAPVPRNRGVDHENRTYRTSNKKHPRPRVANEPSLVNTSSAVADKTGLPLKLLTDDAHSLERQGLTNMASNQKFNYRHGRSYVNMPEKTRNFVDQKHKQSSGAYIASSNEYVNRPEDNLKPNNMQKCTSCFYACDNVCARCLKTFYCSVDCQLRDWPKHRYICGKPIDMQKTPPQNRTVNKCPDDVNEKNKITVAQEPKPHNLTNCVKKQPTCSENVPKNLPKNNPLNNQQQQQSTFSKSYNNNFIEKSSSEHKTNKLPSSTNNTKNSNQPNFSQQQPKSATNSSNNLKNVPPASKEEEIYKNMPKSGSIVTITTIIKTNVVFVRSKTYDDDLSYFEIINKLQEIGKNLSPLTTLPKCGQMIVAKFENQFNRGLVCNITTGNNIIINFMDYGNIERLNLSDLYKIPEEFFHKPRHAIPVLLKDVPQAYMTEEIRNFMYGYLNNINVEMHYKKQDYCQKNDVFAVELIDDTTHQNLNKTIITLSKPVEPQPSQKICDREYLVQKALPSGDNVQLFVMDNSLMSSGCISCTTDVFAVEIQKFQKDLQSYGESLNKEAYTPRVQELCIARYSEDNLWYRGICLETVGDGHPSIHFIDYGNITTVPIEDIRRYPPQFTFPIYTADCEIKGLPEFCDDNLVAKLEELIPNGKSIKCENVLAFEEENFYNISLPNVISELINCGLIKQDQHVL